MNPKTPFIPFAGFVPDADPTTVGSIVDCQRMIPTLRGMEVAPMPSATVLGTYPAGWTGQTVYGIDVLEVGTSVCVYAGTQNKIWMAANDAPTWTDYSKTGGYTGNPNAWMFASLGTDVLACQDVSMTLQRQSLAVPAAAFADIASAPKASIVTTAERFALVFNGYMSGGFGGNDFRDGWGCSARDNAADWTASTSTQCTFGRIVDAAGPIVAAKPLGNDVVAYKPRSMHVGRYTRDSEVWTWVKLPWKVGAMSKRSVIETGGQHYILGRDNLYRFDGARLDGLMDGRVRQWFVNRFEGGNAPVAHLAHDQSRNLIWVRFNGADGVPHSLVYHYASDRWGYYKSSATMTAVPFPGGTFEQLGSLAQGAALYAAQVRSSDNKLVLMNTAYNAAIDTDSAAGTPYMAMWDFGDDFRESELKAQKLRMLTANGTITCTPYTRAALDAPLTAGSDVTRTADGKHEARQSARWHRLKFSFTQYCELTGITMDWSGQGVR